MNDPRAANCTAFKLNSNGKVVGVELVVDARPDTRYALKRVELIDEIAAQGNTVATCSVLDKDGLQTGRQVSLAWPWPGLTDFALPGNPHGQHMITNGYTPPNVGPLALCIRDGALIVSDVVGGLGLPLNRHVCYQVIWQERTATTDDAEESVTPGMWGGVVELARIATALERLAIHFGAVLPDDLES